MFQLRNLTLAGLVLATWLVGNSTPSFAQGSYAYSKWIGSENLPGFGRLEFRFGQPDEHGVSVVMIDAKGRTQGRATHIDEHNRITINFPGYSSYTGTMNWQTQTFSGTARTPDGKTTWRFSVRMSR